MKARAAGHSDIGKVRETNEDQFVVDEQAGFFAVADGMGGHAAGEIASDLAIRSVTDAMRAAAQAGDVQQARRLIEDAVVAANRQICDSIAAHDDRRGMGTTMVILLAIGDNAVIGHVGDSRVYLLRDGRLRQLTSDHSWVNEQVKLGVLSQQEAHRHPMRNVVTRALGSRGEVRPELSDEKLEAGDLFLLCSDGLNVMLTDELIRDTLLAHRSDPDAACRALIRAANERGGEDNTTVIVLAVE